MMTTLQTPRTLVDLVRENASKARVSTLLRETVETLDTQGFPTPRHEQWRYFPTGPILENAWQPAEEANVPELKGAVPAMEGGHLTIVNGRLSGGPMLPAGVSVEVVGTDGELPAEVASTYAASAHPFAALNLVLTPEVVVIRVSANAVVPGPIHLDFHSVAGDAPTIVTPRVLIIAGTNSRTTFLETWSGSGSLLVVPVIEMFAAAGANLDHVRLVLEGDDTIHVANHRARVERDSVLRSFLISAGGGRVRNEIAVTLDGEGADVSLDGLWMLNGEQRADQHTTLDHARPHTSSRELYKGIVGDRSNGIFEGMVVVRRDAQKISSQQTNNNLLLSSTAVADSKPQLEIYADDVRCTHGSTIGQLDEDAVFYLQSRGVGLDDARRILTLAFAGEMIDRLPIPSLHEPLREMLAARVPRAEAAR